MRTAFVDELSNIVKQDKNVILITGDMGYSVFENFQKQFPQNFINAGISEANMVGIAAGLALAGKKIFLYTFASFDTMRSFEQVRIDLCYQNLNVNIIGLGGGITYGKEGSTHQALEDIALMKSLPNMTVLCPGDPIETKALVSEIIKRNGPSYIRIGKAGEPIVYNPNQKFAIGKNIKLNQGKDGTIFTTGNMLASAKQLVSELHQEGLNLNLYQVHTIKPLDKSIINDDLGKFIFTIEEHSEVGGLGSSIAELLYENRIYLPFFKISLPDAFIKEVGTQDYLRNIYGLSVSKMKSRILSQVKNI
ncbi:MAG: transketolase C-terminal domain-containing protein [bacterium]